MQSWHVEFVRDDDAREIIILLKVNYGYDKESNESSEVVISDGIIFNTGYESPFSRNRILFGAPGTGKSFTINSDRVELLGEGNEEDYERVTLQERLSTINFAIKSENIIGLQLADFIPNPLARLALGKSQKPFSILEGIKTKVYDGAVGMKDRFGFKIIK